VLIVCSTDYSFLASKTISRREGCLSFLYSNAEVCLAFYPEKACCTI
jgi:hypothetical protein